MTKQKFERFEVRAEHVVLGLVLLFVLAFIKAAEGEFARREGIRLGARLADRADRYW